MTLAVVSTHPIQYHAPVYRTLQTKFGIPVMAIYGSDFSIRGYHDQEFNTAFAWDTDLLSGYSHIFLSQAAACGARAPDEVTARGLEAALRRVRPDALLLIGYRYRLYYQAFWFAQRMHLPILFRAEVTDHARPRGWIKRQARDGALRVYYRRCAGLLYIGRRAYEHFRRLGCPEQHLFFSPYCVDTSAFQLDETARMQLRRQARSKLNIANDQAVFLFSGKLSPRKAPDMILSAAKELSPDLRRKVVVLFLGEGELRESLRALAADAPRVETRLLGFQNQQALSQFYHAADVCVLPSLRGETWGLVVNEALHHGIPCIVSDAVGCAPDLITSGITGEVFQAGDSHQLAIMLQRVLAWPDRAEVRRYCCERAAQYTSDRAAEGLAQAYEHVTHDA